LPQAEEKTPPFGSLAGSQAATDNGPPAVAEPLSTSALIEPEKMRTDLQSDGAPVPTVTLPQIVKKAKAKPARPLNTEAAIKSHSTVPGFTSPKASGAISP
jgi:hypothetical protein